MKPRERFFFCHLQKTGGTSLQMALRKQFGPTRVYPLPDDRKDVRSQIDIDFLRASWAEHQDDLRVVTGHFPLCTTELLGGPFRTFTVLREPVERTLSFLRHRVRLEPHLADRPLADVYGEPRILHSLIENHMVKMLSLRLDEMKAGAMTMTVFSEDHLERACRALDEIDVVGLQVDIAGFYRALEDEFGWDLGVPLEVNVTVPPSAGGGDAVRHPGVDEALIARIRRDNALDVRLYDHAVALVTRRGQGAP